MLSDTDVENHFSPSVRLINFEKNGASCGFQLTRGKWDPYPWVNSVVAETAADSAGIKPGDCLLEVNGEDILGRRISEVAEIVKSKPNQVSLLLWNAGVNPQCTPEAVCCGPMPTNLQRLSACMSTILAFLECPVCLDTIPPPTYQCENGHLICIRCRTKSERCPVCRLRFTRGRSLLSDQVYNALIDAFNLREYAKETRSAKMQQIFNIKKKNKNVPNIKVIPSHAHKFLARIVGKSSSVDNLTTSGDNQFNLTTKSLSTNEIFQMESPFVSRSNSTTRLNRQKTNLNQNLLDPNCRSVSCHGSFESLQTTTHEAHDQTPTLFCPFAANCSVTITGKNIVRHFQQAHEGPLVQYFKPQINIRYDKILKHQNLCYLMQIDRDVFFLKVGLDTETESPTSDNVLLWMWLADDAKAAKEFHTQVKVLKGESRDVIISVRSNIFSLTCDSYQEIIKHKKCLLVNTRSFDTPNDIIFDVNVLKSDCM